MRAAFSLSMHLIDFGRAARRVSLATRLLSFLVPCSWRLYACSAALEILQRFVGLRFSGPPPSRMSASTTRRDQLHRY